MATVTEPCRFCADQVISADAFRCVSCSKPYHKSCYDNVNKRSNGALFLCCPPTSVTQNQDSMSILASLGSLAAQFSNFRTEQHSLKKTVENLGEQFVKLGSKVEVLEQKNVVIDKKLADLQNRVDKLPAGNKSSIDNLTIREYEDFIERRSNVIIFNLTDKQNIPVNELKLKHKQGLLNLIEYIGLTDKVTIKFFTRLGKPVANNNSCRPIKIIFTSQEQALLFTQTFWAAKKDLTKYPDLRTATIAPDRTPTQRKLYQTCRSNLLKMSTQEQVKHKIVFKGYHPIVVKKKLLENIQSMEN